MKEIFKRAMIAMLVVLVIIQFFHPHHNESTVLSDNEITKTVNVPENVKSILQNSCYDCHSNNTQYPWYSNIQPVDWWLNNHVTDGKKHLNFSEFGRYSLLKQSKKLSETAEEIEEGGMPLPNYTLIHQKAKLTDEQKKIVMDWATTVSKEQYAKLTPDEIAADKKRQEERNKEK